MNDSVSNNLLRLTPEARPSPHASHPTSSTRDIGGDTDSFSRLLERRMNDAAASKPAAERPRAAERQPEREPVRSREAAREAERDRQPVRERASPDSAPPRTTAERGSDTERAAEPAARSAADDEAGAGAEPPATEERSTTASSTDVTATSDPTAAIIAALPVAAAASAPAPLTADAESVADPLTSGGAGTQATSIEKLLADVGTNDAGAAGKETIEAKANAARSLVALAASATSGSEASIATPGGAQPLAAESPPGLAPANVPPGARTDSQAATQLRVHTPLGQPAWADDVGERLTWMLGRHESKAELVLTPASLGKLEVSIQLGGDQATAHFVAASAATRDALEQAMPRLREVLQQAGIQLGQANVSTSAEQQAQHGGFGEQHGGRRPGDRGYGVERDDGEIAVTNRSSGWQRGAGLVDTFA